MALQVVNSIYLSFSCSVDSVFFLLIKFLIVFEVMVIILVSVIVVFPALLIESLLVELQI